MHDLVMNVNVTEILSGSNFISYVFAVMITFFTHPLSSTSCTVLLVSLKLKHLLTFIPILPGNRKWPFVQRLFLPKEKRSLFKEF